MSNLFDKWKESVITVYDSQELSTLELLEDITSFNEEISKGIDGLDSKLETELSNKTDLNGDHKGSWQGLSRPTLSEEGMRATVEKLNADVPKLENDIVKINSSLEQKAPKTDLNNTIADVENLKNTKRDKTEKITSSDMDKSSESSKIGLDGLKQEVITAIAGNTTINSTIVTDESLVYEKYARKSITDEHLKKDYLVGIKGKNLFNASECTDGYYVKVDGILATNTNYAVTGFIPVEENTTYTMNNVQLQIVFFKLDKTRKDHISANGTVTFTTPVGCRFIRTNISIVGGHYYLDRTMLNLGDSILPFEQFKTKIDLDTIEDLGIPYYKLSSYLGLIVDNDVFEFHMNEGRLKILKSFVLSYENKIKYIPQSNDILIENFSTANVYYIYSDLANAGKIVILQSEVKPNAKSVLLAIVKGYTLVTVNTKAFTMYDPSNTLIKERAKYLDNSALFFNDDENRLILPSKIFVADDDLNLFKKNFISSYNVVDGFEVALTEQQPSMNNKTYGISYNYVLNNSTMADKIRIALLTNNNTGFTDNHLRYKDIAKVYSSNKTGTVKGLLIGDSLTENMRMHTWLGNYLKNKGITFKSIGTYLNDTYGKCEGKAAWTYTHNVGIDTVMGSDRILPQGTGDTTNRQCAFLYLATSDDKANRGDWCFRNTGKNDELSYNQDTDKTGDFYIFDFKRYITEHNLEVPNIVTIALGNNDAWVYERNITRENKALLSMEIMIKQIKSAYPNMKIGIVPPLCPATNYEGNILWKNSMSHMIERIIKKVEEFQLTYNNLEIVPTYLFINRDFSFGLGDVTDLNSENTSKKAKRNEFVHYNTTGANEYVRELGAYYINMI